MQIHAVRPPFVEFKRIAVHDPIRSEELGRRVTKDEDFAFIMQPGSKDCVEIKAEDWLASIKRKQLDATPDAMPPDWVDAFHKKYDAFKNGMDMPLNGTSVKEWPVLSPAQAQNFIGMGILTIEDVAAMTEEAMAKFGMGSRELKNKANEWLNGKESTSALIKENEELKTRLAILEAKLNAFVAPKVENTDSNTETEVTIKKRGRPHKKENA